MNTNLIGEDLEMPLSQEFLQLLLKVWSEGPWSTKCRGSWGRLAMPPFDGCINRIQGKGAERLLDVVCQPAKGIA